jgi:hypothetical protein
LPRTAIFGRVGLVLRDARQRSHGQASTSQSAAQTNLPNLHYSEGVANRVEFARVGVMHNFRYLGGLVGIVTALL